MAGAGRPKKRDDWQGDDPVVALYNYRVTPDFRLEPKSTWEYINPVLQPEYEQMLQDEINRVKNIPGVLDILNNGNFGEDWLRARQKLHELNIQKAWEEGRIAQNPMTTRAPASQNPVANPNKLMEMQKKGGWSKQPTRNQMIPSHSTGADMKSYETRNLWEDFWRNPENIKKAKELGIIK